MDYLPEGVADGLSQVVIGGQDIGEALVDDPRLPLFSAKGTCAMARAVGRASPPG
jgi:aldehyde dehydrogenase (NAD+)